MRYFLNMRCILRPIGLAQAKGIGEFTDLTVFKSINDPSFPHFSWSNPKLFIFCYFRRASPKSLLRLIQPMRLEDEIWGRGGGAESPFFKKNIINRRRPGIEKRFWLEKTLLC